MVNYVKMVQRLVKAGMCAEKALAEVCYGYHLDLKALTSAFKKEIERNDHA